jgi:hypothetical protein
MPTIERCLKQITPPFGYFPGKRFLNGECKDCKYDFENNKKCPCYEIGNQFISEEQYAYLLEFNPSLLPIS